MRCFDVQQSSSHLKTALRTSTVGFPLESKISRARTLSTEDIIKQDEDFPTPKGETLSGLAGEKAYPGNKTEPMSGNCT
jgi:hypothetical protein